MESHQIPCTKMTTFPQPTRPMNSYYPEAQPFPEAAYPVEYYYRPEDRFPGQFPDVAPAYRYARAMEEGEKETVEELLEAILELYRKLPESIRRQVDLSKFNVPDHKLRGLRVQSTTSRGSHSHGSSLDELKHKLERFKVRTIQIGSTVVKQDEEDNR